MGLLCDPSLSTPQSEYFVGHGLAVIHQAGMLPRAVRGKQASPLFVRRRHGLHEGCLDQRRRRPPSGPAFAVSPLSSLSLHATDHAATA